MTLELEIERPVAGGDMLARDEGRVVFVSGAIPGERVLADVTRRQGSVSWARVTNVLQRSDDRVEVVGDPRCGGRAYAHIRYERQLALKAQVIADAFRRIAKHPLEAAPGVIPSPRVGYRLRALLHAEGRRLGFFKEGSHTLCDPEPTAQLSVGMLAAATAIQERWPNALESSQSILISENVVGTQRVAVCRARPGADVDAFLNLSPIDGLTGVSVETDRGGFAPYGVDRLEDRWSDFEGATGDARSMDVHWSRRGGSFFQGNRFLLGPLVNRVVEAAADRRFVDLYAGVGLFAVPLAARGNEGVAVEGETGSARDLASNATVLAPRLATHGVSVESFLSAVPDPRAEVMIVDPPRTGLSAAALDGVVRWRAPRAVYVSCDVATLARDAGRMIANGYTLSSIEGLDMFPMTAHVESIAVFDRT